LEFKGFIILAFSCLLHHDKCINLEAHECTALQHKKRAPEISALPAIH
jgi:hypothetical protein